MTKTTVVICTTSRTKILADTIESLSLQAVRPSEVLVSIADLSSVSEEVRRRTDTKLIQARGRGLTIQRNSALDQIVTPYTLFLDDDVELSNTYIAEMQELFDSDVGIVLSSGATIADGARGDVGISRSSAKVLLSRFKPRPCSSCASAYGCNMFVRTAVLKQVGFDESLPLYGWLEDLDFSVRCRLLGRISRNNRAGIVHLGTPSGRMSGLRLGYSQIANPYYLWVKLAEPSFLSVLIRFWMRYLMANAAYAIAFWIGKRGDRPDRLFGNCLALVHLLRGKLHPAQIIDLASS